MDNRIFNVNGAGDKQLAAVLELVFNQLGERTFAKGWSINEDKGLILHAYHSGKPMNEFPIPLRASEALPMVLAWLKDADAGRIKHTSSWDQPYNGDGDNRPGWRVYCEDWGQIAGLGGTICAIKPTNLWFGK